MKVTYLLLDYPPHRFIGAEIAAHRLIKALKARGHQVEVRILAESAAQFDGVRAVPHRTTPLTNPDVVMTNVGLATRARSIWVHSPLVVWAHNNQVSALLDAKEAHPQVLILNTNHMREVFRSVNGQDGLVLYPIPDPDVRPLNPLTGDAFTIINASREKGGHVVEALAERMPDQPFLFVRGGHGSQIVPDLPNVEIMPPTRDLEPVWAKTRTLLVPSRVESYSMVGFEALQRGIHTIAIDLPGVREALGPQERYVSSREPDDWAWAVLNHVHEGPKATRHAMEQHVQQRLNDSARQVEAVIREVERAGEKATGWRTQ